MYVYWMISLSNSKRVIIVVLSIGLFIVLSALVLLAAALASCVGREAGVGVCGSCAIGEDVCVYPGTLFGKKFL